jgi:hypothetical protein
MCLFNTIFCPISTFSKIEGKRVKRVKKQTKNIFLRVLEVNFVTINGVGDLIY